VTPFVAIVPARLGSTRLPEKPLADIAGLPMVVHVARRAAASGASRVVVATDSGRVVDACTAHAVEAMLTRADHATGTDRLSEVALRLALADDAIVVNVQGDEPLIPPALIRACAERLAASPDCQIATAAHAIERLDDFLNPNVVKVVLDAAGRALYFSRAPIPWPRDAGLARSGQPMSPQAATVHPEALRHVGLYAYRVGFLRRYPDLPIAPLERLESLEQLRALANGDRISVLVTDAAPPSGVDTAEDLEAVRRVLGQSQ
jgi:3-deoxy-manno-octulosonate cytidylyltransferase (CMP-KDO synthetase)